MSDHDFGHLMAAIIGVVLVVLGLWASFYGPCSMWRGSSLTQAPARCIPELAK